MGTHHFGSWLLLAGAALEVVDERVTRIEVGILPGRTAHDNELLIAEVVAVEPFPRGLEGLRVVPARRQHDDTVRAAQAPRRIDCARQRGIAEHLQESNNLKVVADSVGS